MRCTATAVSAYLLPPIHGQIYADDRPEPEIIEGQPIPGHPRGQLDDGVDALHADFLNAIAEGRQPLTNIHDVIHTVRLLEEIGQLDPTGQPLKR